MLNSRLFMTVLEKIRALKEYEKRKGCVTSFNPLHHVLYNKTAIMMETCYLFNMVHDMLNSGKLSLFMRNGLWAKAMNTTILLGNSLLTSTRGLSPFQHFWEGKEMYPNFGAKNGELYITTQCNNSHQAKLTNIFIIGI